MVDKALLEIVNNYAVLSEEALVDFKEKTKLIFLKRGDQLVKEGNYSNTLYYIVSGSAKAFYTKEGKEITDWFAFEADFICAINSYFSLVPSPHAIAIMEDSVLLAFQREDLGWLSKKHHDFEHLMLIAVTRIMLKLQKRIVSLQFAAASDRYKDLIQHYPKIELRVPLGAIASFLGITQETLSRIRAKN